MTVNEPLAGASSQIEGVRAMPGVASHRLSRLRPQVPRALRCFLLATLAFNPLLTIVLSESARAEVRIVTAQGEHRMGDRDTKEDAVRLATEEAKRNALEQVATYLESVTVVTDLDVTKDEIRTYTAGVVLVLDQQVGTTLDGDSVVIRVDMTAQIDTDEVIQAIAALRENQDARQELVALKQEVDQLHQELDAANQALVQATTPEQVQVASRQRQEILNKVQSNAMVSQAWTDWILVAPVIGPYPWVGLAQVQALLNVAGRLNPNNPHVHIVQQAIATRPVPAPPQPPTPRASTPMMPTHQIVPQQPATAGPVSPTLNEIHQSPPPSRRLTDIRQLNPLLPPDQRSAPPSTLHSYQPDTPSAHTPRAVPPHAGRRSPPTINQIHPPMPHQVPRAPYQLAPRVQSGGGGHKGGGKGGGRK